nr:ABC transporter ATP-binding protein [Treponema denticola]
MNPILEVKNLEVRFLSDRAITYAVNDINFDVNKGETLGIVGESGSGKSVTAKAILKLLNKNTKISGSIIFDKNELINKNDKYMQKIRGSDISMVFQDPMTSLNPLFSIETQMKRLIKRHKTGITNLEVQELIIKYLELVGIPDAKKRLKSYPHEFSGGMRQRVMIAMALCLKSKLIIADEPTTALDVTIQAQILNLINDISADKDRSVVLITHDMGVVANTCDRVIVMYSGMIMEEADVQELFGNPKHPYTIGLLDSLPKNNYKERLTPILGNPPDMTQVIIGCPFYDRCKHRLQICKEHRPSLKKLSYNHTIRCHLFGENR